MPFSRAIEIAKDYGRVIQNTKIMNRLAGAGDTFVGHVFMLSKLSCNRFSVAFMMWQCACYLNDIVKAAEFYEDPEKRLEEVLKRLEKHNVKLNKKVHFPDESVFT